MNGIKQNELLNAVKVTLLEFFKCTGLNGFKLLYAVRNLKIQRCIWAVVLLASLAFSIFVVIFAWNSFMLSPTITTLESHDYPFWKTPFPAVSVCSANKISKRAIVAYAELLHKKSYQTVPVDVILKYLRLLSGLYDSSKVNSDEALELHNFLDKFDSDNPNEFYDVKKALRLLAPKCEEILQKCRWAGVEVPCESIFRTIATPEGICCVFNYFNYFYSSRMVKKTQFSNSTGFKNGLTILLNTSTADYFYKSRSTDGMIVQIFNQMNFPDETTGSLKEVIVPSQSDVYLKLLVTTLQSDEAIRTYPVWKRKCYFADEKYKSFGGRYSYADCLTKCKLRSIQALCQCIPHYAPPTFINDSKAFTFCSLTHVACLERYRVTWNTYRPMDDDFKGLEQEMEDSLSCADCFPLCTDTKYNFQLTMSEMPFGLSYRNDMAFLHNITDLTNSSVLRVYYATGKSMLYKKSLVYTWYEILGNYGGLLGICIGCSIISFIEFLYFATVHFYNNFKRLNSHDTNVELQNENDVFPYTE